MYSEDDASNGMYDNKKKQDEHSHTVMALPRFMALPFTQHWLFLTKRNSLLLFIAGNNPVPSYSDLKKFKKIKMEKIIPKKQIILFL